MPTLRLLGLRKDPFQVPKSVQEVGGGVGCQIMGLSVTSSIWVGKPLPLRCKSFNHADSVLTKSCEPMGARNSQHDVIMVSQHELQISRIQARGWRRQESLFFLSFCITKTDPPFQIHCKWGIPKGNSHFSTPLHIPFPFCLQYRVRRLMKMHSKIIRTMKPGMNIWFPLKLEYSIWTSKLLWLQNLTQLCPHLLG